jgi:hypothetical protein
MTQSTQIDLKQPLYTTTPDGDANFWTATSRIIDPATPNGRPSSRLAIRFNGFTPSILDQVSSRQSGFDDVVKMIQSRIKTSVHPRYRVGATEVHDMWGLTLSGLHDRPGTASSSSLMEFYSNASAPRVSDPAARPKADPIPLLPPSMDAPSDKLMTLISHYIVTTANLSLLSLYVNFRSQIMASSAPVELDRYTLRGLIRAAAPSPLFDHVGEKLLKDCFGQWILHLAFSSADVSYDNFRSIYRPECAYTVRDAIALSSGAYLRYFDDVKKQYQLSPDRLPTPQKFDCLVVKSSIM